MDQKTYPTVWNEIKPRFSIFISTVLSFATDKVALCTEVIDRFASFGFILLSSARLRPIPLKYSSGST